MYVPNLNQSALINKIGCQQEKKCHDNESVNKKKGSEKKIHFTTTKMSMKKIGCQKQSKFSYQTLHQPKWLNKKKYGVKKKEMFYTN